MNDRISFKDRYLASIQPSFTGLFELKYYPAAAVCSNGERHDRVIFIDEQDARKKIGSYDWLTRHSSYWKEKVTLDYRLIESIRPSEKRIPCELVDQILNGRQGASVAFQTNDGKIIVLDNWRRSLLGQVDFLELPQGRTPADLKSMIEYKEQMRYAPDAKLYPMGDIRICVFPSQTEQRVGKPLHAISEGNDIFVKNDERFPIKINQSSIDRMNEIMRSSALIHSRPASPDCEGKDWMFVLEPKRLDKRLIDELAKIDPGKSQEYPCMVTLKDGTVVENVVLIKHRIEPIQKILSAFSYQYILPHFEYYINANDVCAIEVSPNALPAFVRGRPDVETSMGSQEFKVEMDDGTMHACWYGGQNDFIDLPPPYRASEIKSFKSDRGYASQGLAYVAEPIYAICIFR